MIKRLIENKINKDFTSGKAIIIMGARQVGKTTIINEIMKDKTNVLWLNGDEPDVRNIFHEITSSRLKMLIGDNKYLVIDEAQRIDDIGLKMKLITDQLSDVQLIATGSSSFELADKTNEPLTGRKNEYKMYPLSYEEMVKHNGFLEEKRLLPHRLVYGSYPEVVTNPGNEKKILHQLSDSFLYKDILMLDQIKKSDKITKLLQALAFQVGSQVSYSEVGQICGLDYKTVEKYIDLLEKSYVIFRLNSFSRNLRNELKKSRKVYFYDNGIRNAVIANFSQVELRTDIGALWENYLISERIKSIEYNDIWTNIWFWRTNQQKEIDLIEESDGKLSAYEFKWNPKSKYKEPAQFLEAYPNSQLKVITPDNYEEFLT